MPAAPESRHAARLAIGTAQFGMDYGICGGTKVEAGNVARILEIGRASGVDTIDTAATYGDSEQVLGQAGLADWRVVTKVPPLPEEHPDPSHWVSLSLRASLARLKVARLHGLLLHQSRDLLRREGSALYAGLKASQQEGVVDKIGISVYDPSELNDVLPRYPMSLVQAPFSVVDRRLERSGWLDRLHAAAIEVHVRSIFLQGLLLEPYRSRPSAFSRWDQLWKNWDNWLRQRGVSALQGCLGFVVREKRIDRVVVGIDSPQQLREILGALDAGSGVLAEDLVSEDHELIDPSKWKRCE